MVTSQLGLRGLRGRGSNLHFTDDQATAPKGDTGEQRARNKVGEETLGSDSTLGTFWTSQTPAALHELNQTAFEKGQLCIFTATLGTTALGWDRL